MGTLHAIPFHSVGTFIVVRVSCVALERLDISVRSDRLNKPCCPVHFHGLKSCTLVGMHASESRLQTGCAPHRPKLFPSYASPVPYIRLLFTNTSFTALEGTDEQGHVDHKSILIDRRCNSKPSSDTHHANAKPLELMQVVHQNPTFFDPRDCTAPVFQTRVACVPLEARPTLLMFFVSPLSRLHRLLSARGIQL